MVRRLNIGKNNHLICYSLAISPRFVISSASSGVELLLRYRFAVEIKAVLVLFFFFFFFFFASSGNSTVSATIFATGGNGPGRSGQQWPLEGIDEFYCRWGRMGGGIDMQKKDIFSKLPWDTTFHFFFDFFFFSQNFF